MAVKITIPISLEHVFNTHDRTENIGYGLGWRLNYSQMIEKVVLGTTNYYRHIDEDGTRHYYRYASATQYVSELDTDSTLTIDTARHKIAIVDKAGNKLVFACDNAHTTGRLIREEDANGNAIVIRYTSTTVTNLRIALLTEAHVNYVDGAEGLAQGTGVITLAYDSSSLLSLVTPPDGLAVRYTYTSSRLTNILYADNNGTVYTYDAKGNLASAKNIDGYKISYEYTPGTISRVTLITESNEETQGQKLQLRHGWNRTTFGDSFVAGQPTRFSSYFFDNMGKTVTIQDAEGRAQYVAYNTADRTVKQISAVSKLQKANANILPNHGMERSGVWTYGTGASQDATRRYAGKNCVKLNNSDSTMSAYISQTVNVTGGETYTLSGYFSGISNGVVEALSGSTLLGRCLPVQTAGTDWYRGHVTFTVPSGLTAITVRASLPAGNVGVAYVDAMQLEKGDTISRYNMLENSDFSLGNTTHYTAGSGNGPNCGVITTSDSSHPAYLGNKVFHFAGDYLSVRTLTQSVPAEGVAGDTYVFGCWIQCYGIPQVNTTYNIRRITLNIINGSTVVNTKAVNMNVDTDEWQFMAAALTATGAYTQLQLTIEYTRTRNHAYFDGLFLSKEAFASAYSYDAKGNPVTAKSIISQTESAQYDANSNLTKLTNPLGNARNFTYDGKHNLLTATSAEGVRTANTYNSRGQVTNSKLGSTTNYINSDTIYDPNTGMPTAVKDARGNTISYVYYTTARLLASVTDARGNTTSNSYADASGMRRLLSTTAPTGTGSDTATVSYDYEHDRLSAITRNYGTADDPALSVYTFVYDELGRMAETKVGSTTLCENTYNARALLEQTSYANGYALRYEYDNLDRVILAESRPDGESDFAPLFRYGYDNDGNLAYSADLRSATAGFTRYDYDLSGRLMRANRYDDENTLLATHRYAYDVNNRLTKLSQTVAGRSWDVIYSYDRDDRPKTAVSTGMATVTDSYDAVLGLKTSRSIGFGTPHVVSYGYHVNANGTKTALLSSYKNGTDSAYTYAYDANGNITQIAKGNTSATYVYDKANQLIRENDGFSGKTWTYSYDKFGNMLEKSEYAYTTGTPGTPIKTYAYIYSTGEWKDQLTSYDGETISYDAMGNPTSYRGNTLTWTDGRKLASFGTAASYVYDREGMRVQKTVGDTVTDYFYNGKLLMAQTTGNVSQYYNYDANGNLIAIYYNNAYYYYLRNGQGDIVGLMDGTGSVVVNYAYNAWGKLLSTTGTLATTLGVDNPFRYRGYYYDTETGLYYLQARYYDPEVCRFLNGDVLMSTGQGILGFNRYVYCLNNPCILQDSHGTIPVFNTKKTDSGGKNVAKKSTFSTEVPITGLYRSAETAAAAWADSNIADARNDHRERGALIHSVTIAGSEFYYPGNTFVGNNGTVAVQFLATYIGAKNVTGFVHIHTADPPTASDPVWRLDDRGPSKEDYFLFNLPGINSQFIMNEKGNFYPFFQGVLVDLEEINKE